MAKKTAWVRLNRSFSVEVNQALLEVLSARMDDGDRHYELQFRTALEADDHTQQFVEWRCLQGAEAGYKVGLEAFVDGWAHGIAWVADKFKSL